ncbi:MAG: glycosyltransferase [Patescibacteria group bacterium]|nr:glycosyltransferase [Patescibacteria group bacterium]MCL5224408.1 glycosyltransferase [Patescibacteria group bacterium]
MDKKPHLSLIIAACDGEADRLPLTLVDADRHLRNSELTYEIIVVRSDLVNGAVEQLDRFAKLLGDVKIIAAEGKGRGTAVKTGMLAARGKYRAFIEADNPISIDQIVDALPYFKNGYDVVVGSRSMKGGRHGQVWYRIVAGELMNLLMQVLLLPGIWDAHCPLKVFRDDVAERVFGLSKINRSGFDVEVLALSKKLGYKAKQIPVVSAFDYSYRVKPVSSRSMVWDALQTRFWLWADKYKFYVDAPPK